VVSISDAQLHYWKMPVVNCQMIKKLHDSREGVAWHHMLITFEKVREYPKLME
jgi:hypothetical protein